MKIIDSHIHIGTSGSFDLKEHTVINSMNKYSINRAVVSNLEGAEYNSYGKLFKKQIRQLELNFKTLNFVKAYSERLKGLFWIKPALEGFSKEIENFYINNKNYFSGFKAHPFHSLANLTEDCYKSYLEFAEEHNLCFAVHTATDYYSKPIWVYKVAKKYQNIKFIMVHMELGSDNNKAINLISKLPNLYGDTTWVNINSVLKAVEICGDSKILFGTDAPIDGIDTYVKYIDMVNVLKNNLKESSFYKIFYENSKNLFF